MTMPRQKQRRLVQKRRSRARRRSGNWQRYRTEWNWIDTLWNGISSAWVWLCRLLWRIHFLVVLVVTFVIIGHWLGFVRELPESLIVPLRAGVVLYWVFASALWILSRLGRYHRAHFDAFRLRVQQDAQISGYLSTGGTIHSHHLAGHGDHYAGDVDLDFGGGFDGGLFDGGFDGGGDGVDG